MIDLHLIPWRNRLLHWFPLIGRLSELRHLHRASRGWRTEGWTAPVPFFVRRAMLIAEGKAIGAETFVETGTFLGDTTLALRHAFRSVHTIEVQPDLAAFARQRFLRTPSIVLHEGDSAKLLPSICAGIQPPCLFYLDGHYSGGFTGKGENECPAIDELAAIFAHAPQPFRIVIDDARLFGTDPAYPSLERVRLFLESQAIRKQLRIENDALVIF